MRRHLAFVRAPEVRFPAPAVRDRKRSALPLLGATLTLCATAALIPLPNALAAPSTRTGSEAGRLALTARSALPRSTRLLAPTAALKAAVRASFYAAYRRDANPRRDFSAPPGLPISTLIGPQIGYAGVVTGPNAAADSEWVVASVCVENPVSCQDAGGFQVFYRSGSAGAFAYAQGGLCLLPAALAARWFPGGHYPLGIICPRAGTLVRRGGLRAGSWTALIPEGWIQVRYGLVHFGTCSTRSLPRLSATLCSSEGGDTDIDVWFNPVHTGEHLDVITCRGGGCHATSPAGTPVLAPPAGARLTGRPSSWELMFQAPASASRPTGVGPGAITGLLLAAHGGEQAPHFPLLSVELTLPPSQSVLANAIVTSFAAG